jgi:hypothetical protein
MTFKLHAAPPHPQGGTFKVSYMHIDDRMSRSSQTLQSHIDNYAFLTAFATTMRCSSLPAHEQGKQFSRMEAAGVRRADDHTAGSGIGQHCSGRAFGGSCGHLRSPFASLMRAISLPPL